MSDGKRYWDGKHSWRAEDFRSTNYVTTRERGVIPGCVPAVDVFIERTPEEARTHVLYAAGRYILDMRTMDFKEFINKPTSFDGFIKAVRTVSTFLPS